jgi:hypothetical protein
MNAPTISRERKAAATVQMRSSIEKATGGKLQTAALLFLWGISFPAGSHAANKTLAGNYDGTNSIDCALYVVGDQFNTTFSLGAMFRVAGRGDIKLSRLILPIGESTLSAPPNPANFRVSIVHGNYLSISDDVIWSGMIGDTGTMVENQSIALSGMVRGGETYWLLFEQTGFDTGSYNWAFASSPLAWCRPDVPDDVGYTAHRYGSNGDPPTGNWYIQPYDIRPAFLIQGNHLPKPGIVVSPLSQFPGVTNLTVIAPNKRDARVLLDGSSSSDEDGDPLHFTWLDGTNIKATTAVATNMLAAGTHWISLIVDDGEDTAVKTVELDVITPSQAVGLLISMVEQADSNGRNKRPLVEQLSVATLAFDRGNAILAVNHLRLFQRMVRAQNRMIDAGTAEQLVATAEEIINRSTYSPSEDP